MTPTWLNDVVRAFGRQMGLTRFELDARGVAGVRFENGLSLRFEYASEALLVTVGVSVANDPETMKRLLAAVHPAARAPLRLRAAYLSRTGEAVYAVRIPERGVTVTVLEQALRALWPVADRLRRDAQ